MTRLIFIDPQGQRHEIEAQNGTTIMENAVKNNISGIDADCGGACACATCHVYVDENFLKHLEPAEEMEQDMLDFANDLKENSRLSCQIEVSDKLDGIILVVPQEQ